MKAIISVLLSAVFTVKTGGLQPDPICKFEKVRLDEKRYQKVQNLHLNWYAISVKALMGELGKDLYKRLNHQNRSYLEKCLYDIEDNMDLVRSAKCLTRARRSHLYSLRRLDTTRATLFYRPATVAKVFDFRKLKKRKNNNHTKRQHDDSTYPSLKIQKTHFYAMKDISSSPVSRVVNLISKITTKEDDSTSWNEIYQQLLKIKNKMETKEKSPSTRPYKFRMYDLVMDNEMPSKTNLQGNDSGALIYTAMELFPGLNESMRAEGNFKLLSPRIAPLMPDKATNSKSILSPTVLSFYDDNSTIASIPSILKLSNLGQKERSEIMNLLMRMSGTTKAIEDATSLLKELDFTDMSEELNEVSHRINNVHNKLKESFNQRQKRDLENNGFTFMDQNQLNHMYNNKEFIFPKKSLDFEDYLNLNTEEKTEALWNSIERIGLEEDLKDYKLRLRRRKRALGSASVFSAVILGPYMFAPSFGLTILGPVILSPNVFSPAILNPSVLSPYILSPGLGLTSILSPYVLSPMILNPTLLSPLVLSPYVLSPNILAPNLLSPIILSPLVLSPDILSPGGIGGAVLSPAVASPAIFTESFLMATILSPTIFS